MNIRERGIKLSRQAQGIVHQAENMGVDSSGVIQAAMETAQAEGRTKIGMFGKGGDRLKYLRAVLENMGQQEAVEKILGKHPKG